MNTESQWTDRRGVSDLELSEAPTAGRELYPSASDALDGFLAEVRKLPLLAHEEVLAVARRIREADSRFRQALCSIPAAAVLVVERWHERRAAGLVTGLLSHHHRDRSDEDWSTFIDERMHALERLIEAYRTGPVAGRADLESALSDTLSSADILIEVLLEVVVELRERLEHPESLSRLLIGDLASQKSRSALDRAERARADRDAARQTLASHNVRLVIHVAKRYRGQGLAFLDLIQEGSVGLLRAVDKFDPDLGYRFSTYGVWWIDQAMRRAIQNYARTVRVPSNLHQDHARIRRAEVRLGLSLGREPSRAEVAGAIGSSEEHVEKVKSAMAKVASLDAPLDRDPEWTLAEQLTGDEEPEVAAAEALDRSTLEHELAGSLVKLKPRERSVIEWRFGISDGEPRTLQEIGERLGLSRERVRQIQAAALGRLRKDPAIAQLASSLD